MANGAKAISSRSNRITRRIGSTGCGTVHAQQRMNGMQGCGVSGRSPLGAGFSAGAEQCPPQELPHFTSAVLMLSHPPATHANGELATRTDAMSNKAATTFIQAQVKVMGWHRLPPAPTHELQTCHDHQQGNAYVSRDRQHEVAPAEEGQCEEDGLYQDGKCGVETDPVERGA